MSYFEKLGIIFSVFIIIVLMVLIVFGPNGLIDYRYLKDRESDVRSQTLAIDKDNQKLEKEIRALKTLEYIEHIAKHEHEMAAEDELIFKIKKPVEEKEE